MLQYSPRTAGSGGAAFWASKGKEVKKAAWNKFYEPTVQKYKALIAKQKAIEIKEKAIADKRKAFSDALYGSLMKPGRGMR